MSKAYVSGLPARGRESQGPTGSSANIDAQAIAVETEAFFTEAETFYEMLVVLRRRVLDRRVTKRSPEPLAHVAVAEGDQCQKRRVAMADLSRTVRACYPTRSVAKAVAVVRVPFKNLSC